MTSYIIFFLVPLILLLPEFFLLFCKICLHCFIIVILIAHSDGRVGLGMEPSMGMVHLLVSGTHLTDTDELWINHLLS